ncbi:DUF6088 family protein [Sphaerochaeta sp. S2]|uniref:DUF6088 family protein n=1 Tax=Sphaerochaeta sp. S2 TaxID=2798868 RepID=UPI0018E92735|nr:DUF6088 family protein [Sphaerochaeta sp. S2]MBJ2355754.1 hypothetical protein [Sphaerochaeta sp. S2]
MQSVSNKILARIYSRGRGWAFSKVDFIPPFSDIAVRKALSELAKKGTIRRVSQGIYHYPRYSEFLQEYLSPDMEQVAYAYARKFNWRIHPSGNTALNYLGLSTQVPSRHLYISDGPNRVYVIENQSLEFKHMAIKETGLKFRESRLLVQALRALGKEHITPEIIHTLSETMKKVSADKIVQDTQQVSVWIYEVIEQILKG